MTLAALLVLAACGTAAQKGAAGYRNAETAIASAALFDAARFAGDWQIVAAYGAEAGCGRLAESWAPGPAGRLRVTGTVCGPMGRRAFASAAAISGPGRISRAGPDGTEEHWVLWVDADYRVAVIGTPSGRFARILSRQPALRPDLLQAARQVLEFNGYNISALKMLQ